jgi:hypothetical protein
MGQPTTAAAHSFYALRALRRTMPPARQRQLLASLQRHSERQVCPLTVARLTVALLTMALLTMALTNYYGTTYHDPLTTAGSATRASAARVAPAATDLARGAGATLATRYKPLSVLYRLYRLS